MSLLRANNGVISSSFIDPASSKHHVVSYHDGRQMELVMSDEFETSGRSFESGRDAIFEAIEKPDDTNDAIEYYSSDKEYVGTKDGFLVIATKPVKRSFTVWQTPTLEPKTYTKNYTSGMVQTWNKFCFTGGILEISLQLPGHADSGGLWPAVWMMGNLGRAIYPESCQYMWPWSYNRCGEIEYIDAKQQISACNGQPGYGLHPHQGRGAPEIDIFEVMPGHSMPTSPIPVRPFMSSSLQISPGLPKSGARPVNGQRLNESQKWYDGLEMSPNSDYNFGFWGQECGPVYDFSKDRRHKYMQDALSVNTFLNETHFDSQHVYRLEWQPGQQGYLKWYLDGELIFSIQGESLDQLTGAMIPEEPMYLVMNTAISHRWGMPEPCPVETCSVCWHCYDCTNPECQCTLPDGMKNCKNMPAEMKIDFVRVYQDPSDSLHTVGCSPPRYPTAEYIAAHAWRYENWKDVTVEDINRFYTTIMLMQLLVALIAAWILRKVWNLWWYDWKGMRKTNLEYTPIP